MSAGGQQLLVLEDIPGKLQLLALAAALGVDQGRLLLLEKPPNQEPQVPELDQVTLRSHEAKRPVPAVSAQHLAWS